MVDRYYYSGSIPEEFSTYVKRKADDELYKGLRDGKFCYVLNSSQSGKSSLRIRTVRRLREDGIECAVIDLSGGTSKNISQEQWYKGLVETLIDYFELDWKFDEWWKQNQSDSGGTRFRKFLEEILLAQIKENIVIFIDEIGSVLGLNFNTDDFFVFIRYCHERRNDDRKYKRLTFCLLGIASPSDLIQDKNITAFNIGKGIFLKPFQSDDEIEPLIKGLRGIYPDPEEVFEQILDWTGGQPFLTQKLCDLMVKESQEENPRNVEQVVRQSIIENWESPKQDDPQHLRTIRDRIIEHKNASALLGLCQRIWQAEEFEIVADDTPDQYHLQLSGLVVKEKNKLRVYNPIYKEIFNIDWIETQLWKFCPYAENLDGWIASNYKDNSRLLRGAMLQEAQEWSKDKSLSPQHERFLSSSQNQEEQEKLAIAKIEHELERERQDKEAAEQRNQVLAEANNTLNEAKKISKRQIRVGSIILGVTFLSSVILGSSTFIAYRTVQRQDESISKIKEIFYEDLENRLKNKELEAADKLTSRIIWETGNKWEAPSFPAEVAQSFPCQDLRRIDDLWVKYSDRRFGFSVQRSIWRSSEVNRDILEFMSRVGWTRLETDTNGNKKILFVPVTNFSLDATEGQLPWLVTWQGSDGTRDRTAYLNRISECLSENR